MSDKALTISHTFPPPSALISFEICPQIKAKNYDKVEKVSFRSSLALKKKMLQIRMHEL